MYQNPPIGQQTTVFSEMQMTPYMPKGSMTVSKQIPPSYAKVTLLGHDRIVYQGQFGTMISQWLDFPHFSICSNHFDFKEASVASMEISEPCTSFFYVVRNVPTIIKREGKVLSQITVERGKIAQMRFDRRASGHKVYFDPGVYRSIHITVPHEHAHLLEDEDWVIKRLNEYAGIIRAQSKDIDKP